MTFTPCKGPVPMGGVAGSGLAERGVAGSGLAERGVAGSGLAELTPLACHAVLCQLAAAA